MLVLRKGPVDGFALVGLLDGVGGVLLLEDGVEGLLELLVLEVLVGGVALEGLGQGLVQGRTPGQGTHVDRILLLDQWSGHQSIVDALLLALLLLHPFHLLARHTHVLLDVLHQVLLPVLLDAALQFSALLRLFHLLQDL